MPCKQDWTLVQPGLKLTRVSYCHVNTANLFSTRVKSNPPPDVGSNRVEPRLGLEKCHINTNQGRNRVSFDFAHARSCIHASNHELWESLHSYILIKLSPYQHLCYIMSLTAPYCSIKSPIFAVFIHISPCFFGFRSRSVSYLYS